MCRFETLCQMIDLGHTVRAETLGEHGQGPNVGPRPVGIFKWYATMEHGDMFK